MGSEHSSHVSGAQARRQASVSGTPRPPGSAPAAVRRQHTIAATEQGEQRDAAESRPGSTSPGPSVCSDTDLPYISYTVNRPIGDSPKVTKQTAKAKVMQRKLPPKYTKKSSHNIVVVKQATVQPIVEKDPDIVRLNNIPMFLPIMRGTLHLPAARDPEVLERLDSTPFYRLCRLYQQHLTGCAHLVTTEQNALTQRVRETDQEIAKMMPLALERQKRFTQHADKLSRVKELSKQLTRCHMILNQTLELMDTLNNGLDIDDRLEPFVWTTG